MRSRRSWLGLRTVRWWVETSKPLLFADACALRRLGGARHADNGPSVGVTHVRTETPTRTVLTLVPVLKDAPKKPAAGTPRAIIVSLSGIRCADVVRVVRHIPRPGGEVAKLFAKHFKLADQAKYLSHSRVAVAVGTPARLAKLLADGALKVSNQTVVLLDVGHRDSKNRSLLTLPEVRDELWKGLLSGAAREALKPVRYTAF